MPDWAFIITAGIILLLLGFLLVAIGMMRSVKENEEPEEQLSPHREVREEKVKGGGVILIGPIPIVFGTDKRFALVAMVLAIVLMLLAIIFLK